MTTNPKLDSSPKKPIRPFPPQGGHDPIMTSCLSQSSTNVSDKISELEQKRRVWASVGPVSRLDSLTVQRRELMRSLKDNYIPK